ncbi:hypothetical protein ES708_19546 [subsurface metagenome]
MDNPYVIEKINILNQIKGWIFTLIGVESQKTKQIKGLFLNKNFYKLD